MLSRVEHEIKCYNLKARTCHIEFAHEMLSKLQQTSHSTGLLASVKEPIVPNYRNMKCFKILSLYGDTSIHPTQHKDSFSERLTKVCLILS